MKREQGFSMLEVLVSMLIILIGVLGTVGIQMMAIKNTGWAQYQGQAAMLASNMAVAMRNNTSFWAVTPPTTVTVNGPTVTATGSTVTVGNCLGAACTPPQQAGYDLSNWGTAIAATLPSGTATVTCPATTTQVVCTITLTWNTIQPGMFSNGTVSAVNYSTLVGMQ